MRAAVVLGLKRFLFLLAIYTFLRAFYFFYNFDVFRQLNAAEILSAFVQGWRFDISAVLKLNGAFFILWLLPERVARVGARAKVVMFIFFFLNGLFMTLNLVDAEMVKFSGQRVTLNYFATAQDVGDQLGQLAFYYWFIVLTAIITIVVFVNWFPRQHQGGTERSWSLAARCSVGIALVAATILGIRGGLQDKPLRPAHAYRFTVGTLGQLALNSTFTLLQSGRSLEQKKFAFMTSEEVEKHLRRDRTSHFTDAWKTSQNVVILIMESWATEFVAAANGAKGYTPFFDRLAPQGLLFKNGFANGRRSIEAVPSILGSVPSLLQDAFLTSSFQGTEFLGLGEYLSARGYHTAFFHGAANGSMFFDTFSARAGFKEYYGLSEYPSEKRGRDYDGFWGVFDEPFFQFAHEKISSFHKPFAAVVFSLSSHQPYTIPSGYAGRFPKGPLEIHESLGYADYALEQFFRAAEKEPWFQNTLFVITGDHTQKSEDPNLHDELKPYRVPIFFYHPRANWPAHDLSRVVQHVDILPTVIDVLGYPLTPLSKVGASVFAPAEDAFIVNRTDAGFWYLDAEYYLRLSPTFELQAFKRADGADFQPVTLEPRQPQVMRFKAFLQYVVNGIIENKLQEGVKASP